MTSLVDGLLSGLTGLPAPKKRRKRRKEKYNSTKRRNMRSRFLRVDPNCFYCRKALSLETSTLDHVIPVCMGGDIKNNLVLACYECNNKKANHIKPIDMDRVLEINGQVEELKRLACMSYSGNK